MKQSTIDIIKLAQDGKTEVCVWGAGIIGRHHGLEILKKYGIKPDYYFDSNSDLWGSVITDNIKCISRAELLKKKFVCFILVSVHLLDEIVQQARVLGIKWIVTYNELCELELQTYFDFMQKRKIAVYTCIVGNYDTIKEPISVSTECDYYVISDQKVESEILKYIDINDVIPNDINDNTRKNRYCKINAHKIFPEYKYSIYHDGSIRLKSNIVEKIECLAATRIVAFANNWFDNVYMEAMRAGEHFRDTKEIIYSQVYKYWLEGMPNNFGSVACGTLIREHNNPVCKKLMNEWWEEVSRFSKKDQISFPYVLWKNGFRISDVPTINGDDYFSEKYLVFEKNHLKSRN